MMLLDLQRLLQHDNDLAGPFKDSTGCPVSCIEHSKLETKCRTHVLLEKILKTFCIVCMVLVNTYLNFNIVKFCSIRLKEEMRGDLFETRQCNLNR